MTESGEIYPGPEYEDTPEEYSGPIELVNWGGHKIAVHGSSRLTTEFFDEIASRREHNRSCMIVITGPPGEGKSYEGLSFCQIFDENFNILDDEDPIVDTPEKDPSQVVFSREQLLYLIGGDTPLEYGQCILPDEAQYAMGARRWYEDIQKDLMESIESVRSKGFIIVIVALHLDLLDKIIRKFVLTYMFHMEERGRASVYRLFTPRFAKEMRQRKLGEIILPLPDGDKCSHPDCLPRKQTRCPYLDGEYGQKCMTSRAKYERRKRRFVSEKSAKALEKQIGAEDKKPKDLDFINEVHLNQGKLQWKAGRLKPSSVQILHRELYGTEISVYKARNIRNQVEEMYPELDHRDKVGEE